MGLVTSAADASLYQVSAPLLFNGKDAHSHPQLPKMLNLFGIESPVIDGKLVHQPLVSVILCIRCNDSQDKRLGVGDEGAVVVNRFPNERC